MRRIRNAYCLVFIEFFGPKKFNVFKALAVENGSQKTAPILPH
jgi:hypothetical protein